MVTTETKVLLIDPGGTPPIRPTGINLPFYPESQPQFLDTGISVTGVNAGGASFIGSGEQLYSFQATGMLTEAEWRSLYALYQWQIQNEATYEVVVYWLFDPLTEIAAARSRKPVPPPALNTAVSVGGGLSEFTYFPVIQGDLEVKGDLVGRDHYAVQLTFYEGTILRP